MGQIELREHAESRRLAPLPVARAEEERQRPHDHGSLHAQQLFRAKEAHPAAIAALQRGAGNRATTAAVQRAVEDDVEGGVEKTSGATDFLSGQAGHWGGGAQFESMARPKGGGTDLAYKYGNTTTGGAGAGAGSSIAGGLAGVGGTVISSIAAEKARKTKNEEETQGRKGEATWRDASRQQKSSVTGAVSSSVGVGGAGVSTASSLSQIASNAGSTSVFAGLNNLLGGIAGIIMLPITALTTGRTVRKAAKQWSRVLELRKRVTDPEGDVSTAKGALQAHQETIPALEATLSGAQDDLRDLQARQRAATDEVDRERGRKTPDVVQIQRLENQLLALTAEITAAERLVADSTTAVDLARTEATRLDGIRIAAEQALQAAHDRIANEQEGPDEIAAYALSKNRSGFFKKVVGAVGGFLGIGGGIAATIASFAAIGATAVVGTAVIATPVGWALCGAAALIALGLGGLQFWKWASKRHARAKKEGMSGAKAFFAAINPFKKIGTSRRERLAGRLWDYASGTGTPAEQTKAKDTIKSLGLDWDGLKMGDPQHKKASLKLIHDKMAS